MRRAFIGLVVACLIAATNAAAGTRITIGYTAVADFAGIFIAEDQGYFARHGLDAHLRLFALNATIPAAIANGSVQIGGPTPAVMLQADQGGRDFVIIAGGSVTDPKLTNAGVLLRPGVVIKSPQDFLGKKVGAPRAGDFLQVLFRRWLTMNGVDYRKLAFVEVPFTRQNAVLAAGEVDAVLSRDPFYSHIVEAGTGVPAEPYVAELPPGTSIIYYASSRHWAAAEPEAVKAFRSAIADANAFEARNPEASRAIIGRYLKLPPRMLARLQLPRLQAEVTPRQVEYWIDMLVEQQMLKSQLTAGPLILP